MKAAMHKYRQGAGRGGEDDSDDEDRPLADDSSPMKHPNGINGAANGYDLMSEDDKPSVRCSLLFSL
jgi:hypothetical protein